MIEYYEETTLPPGVRRAVTWIPACAESFDDGDLQSAIHDRLRSMVERIERNAVTFADLIAFSRGDDPDGA